MLRTSLNSFEHRDATVQADLIKKLQLEIESGITKETQIVYLLAGIRKIIEQTEERDEFDRLKFYCDWALHSRMSGPPAQNVVKILESIYKFMEKGQRAPAHSDAIRLIKFDILKDDLSIFLQKFGLKDFTQHTNYWVVFIYLFSRVVQDCPLEIRSHIPIVIQKISINLETAIELIDDHLPYRVNWQFEARGGLPPARYFIQNSYSISKMGRL